MDGTGVTAIILCGGSARRFGGADKTAVPIHGRPLVAYTIDALRDQVDALIISSGRDAAPYRSLGRPVVIDMMPGQGPLGGIVSAIGAVRSDWILTHPGDVPRPPRDLVERLHAAAAPTGLAVPVVAGQRQNMTVLMRRTLASGLRSYFDAGGRAFKDWLNANDAVSVDMSDAADGFTNVNTPAALEEFAASFGP